MRLLGCGTCLEEDSKRKEGREPAHKHRQLPQKQALGKHLPPAGVGWVGSGRSRWRGPVTRPPPPPPASLEFDDGLHRRQPKRSDLQPARLPALEQRLQRGKARRRQGREQTSRKRLGSQANAGCEFLKPGITWMRPSLSGLAAPLTFTTNASTTSWLLQPGGGGGGHGPRAA